MLCVNTAKVTYYPQFSYLPSFYLVLKHNPEIQLSCESYPRIEIDALHQMLSRDKHLSTSGSLDG